MNAIGGYFELEKGRGGNYPHAAGLKVGSGRQGLELILRTLPENAELIIPDYTCEVILEPIERLNILYHRYEVNDNLELSEEPELKENQYLIYTNYFGIKDAYALKLEKKYGSHLILDNAQAFFMARPRYAQAFYSPRKFVGVPDGGIAFPNEFERAGLILKDSPKDISWNRCSALLKRIDLDAQAGYSDYKKNEEKLVDKALKQMSNLTRAMLESIDWEDIKETRRENFKFLNEALGKKNLLRIEEIDSYACPMVYPFRTKDKGLREALIKEKIFVATYWPNSKYKMEASSERLRDEILPLPIDQRYNPNDLQRIINIINNRK